MRKALISLLAIQALATLAIAGGFYAYAGWGEAAAALFGGATAVAVAGLLAFRLRRASRPGAGVGGLYIGALERFALVGGAFALGLAVLKLAPIPLLAGFAGAEFAYFVAAGLARGETGRSDGG